MKVFTGRASRPGHVGRQPGGPPPRDPTHFPDDLSCLQDDSQASRHACLPSDGRPLASIDMTFFFAAVSEVAVCGICPFLVARAHIVRQWKGRPKGRALFSVRLRADLSSWVPDREPGLPTGTFWPTSTDQQ